MRLLLKGFEIHYLLITLKHAAAEDASLATRQAQRLSDPTVKAADLFVAEHSNGPHFIRVDLVEADEGDPQYQKISGDCIGWCCLNDRSLDGESRCGRYLEGY